jgi:hypothetical protein
MKLGPIALLWFAVLPAGSSAVRATTVWRTYHSQDYGFSIRYPSTFIFRPGHPDFSETANAMIPVCDETTVACFEYNVGDNKGTDFQGAGLSINVLRDRTTEEDCYKPQDDSSKMHIEIIHGIQFHVGETGYAAAGSSGGGDFYRAFHAGVCFELTVNSSETDAWIVADNGPRFPASKERKIERDMDTMLQSFTFTGPVRDGAAWDVYTDSCCGIWFEYPRGDKVEVPIDYEPNSSSPGLTSSQHFLHGGLDYTVAVKSGIIQGDVIETWLPEAGYPGLGGAQLVRHTQNCREYHAEPYYYFACAGDLYILSVSNASHHAVSPQGDPVFTHLLNTFKVQ